MKRALATFALLTVLSGCSADSTAARSAAPAPVADAPTVTPPTPVASPTPETTPPATAEDFPRGDQSGGGPSDRFANLALPPDTWAAGELARRGFRRDPGSRLIALDPGHGGPEVGAAAGRLAEKNVNLAIARQLQALLEAEGYQVLLTREDDDRAYWLPPADSEGSYNPTRADLQARIDLANTARADLFVSIHNNGSTNTSEAGTEVWYAPDRPFGDANHRLAVAVLDGITGELAQAGYAPPNRGLKDGSRFRVFGDRVFPLFVLGNARSGPRPTRATQMPGILGESLFLSNPREAGLLADTGIQTAIARGYLRGINAYFGR